MGALGATIAIVATFLPWYEFGVILQVGRVTHVFDVATALWGYTTVAPILIVVGGFVALVSFTLSELQAARVLAALIGLAVAVYAIVRCADAPVLAVLAGGAPLALAGGLMMMIGGIGDLWWSDEVPDAGIDAGQRIAHGRLRPSVARGRARRPLSAADDRGAPAPSDTPAVGARVTEQRRGLAAAIVLGVAEELSGGVRESRARRDLAGKRPATRAVERVAQPVLGEAPGEIGPLAGVTAQAPPAQDAS